MTIETKYNIGDVVWIKLFNGQFTHGKILFIEITVKENKTQIYYTIEHKKAMHTAWERWCFPTKEELLKSL